MTHTLANGVRICTVDVMKGIIGSDCTVHNGHLYQAGWSIRINLPPGNWTLLGRFEEITEETWKGVVEGYVYSGRSSYQAYKNYSGKNPESEDDILNTATESARSMIAGNPVVLIEKK